VIVKVSVKTCELQHNKQFISIIQFKNERNNMLYFVMLYEQKWLRYSKKVNNLQNLAVVRVRSSLGDDDRLTQFLKQLRVLCKNFYLSKISCA